MRISELLRLAVMNINQNKFKAVMTSIGIVVGAATIVLVIGIGQGGQKEVAEQFASLNAGAINVSYEYEGEEEGSEGGFSFGGIGRFFGNMFGGGGSGNAAFGGMPGGGTGEESGGTKEEGSEGGFSFGGIGRFFGNMFGGGGSGNAAFGGMPGGGTGEESGGTNGMPGGMPQMPGGGTGGDSEGTSGMPGGMPQMSGEGTGEESGGTSGMPGGMPQMPGGGTGEDSGEEADRSEKTPGTGEESGGTSGMPGGMPQMPGGGTGEDSGEEADRSEKTPGVADEEENLETGGMTEEETELETNMVEERLNQEKLTLKQSDVDAIETYVSGISAATISYSTKASVEGGSLESAQTYTVAGVKESFLAAGGLEMAAGDFLTVMDDSAKDRVCVLGASSAKELFGSADDATGGTIYIEDRRYTVSGVLKTSQTVTASVSPDTSILIPYETGIKYVTGTEISPVITVIARDVNVLEDVIKSVKAVLKETYPNASFVFEDSGSKMEAARSSNRTLTLLLSAMAAIVFFVGGIGIMNVLFVSVKERTNEIGILKAIGTPRSNILLEFLTESAAISLIGGMLGVGVSFALLPVAGWLEIRVETGIVPCLIALGFAVLTGTVFGIYPAWKASRLEPVDALNAD